VRSCRNTASLPTTSRLAFFGREDWAVVVPMPSGRVEAELFPSNQTRPHPSSRAVRKRNRPMNEHSIVPSRRSTVSGSARR
jgi:hypothetical protein